MLGYGDTGLVSLSGTRIARIDIASLTRTGVEVPGSGTVNGMAVFGGSAYVMRGNCFYEVSIANSHVSINGMLVHDACCSMQALCISARWMSRISLTYSRLNCEALAYPTS